MLPFRIPLKNKLYVNSSFYPLKVFKNLYTDFLIISKILKGDLTLKSTKYLSSLKARKGLIGPIYKKNQVINF